jgi:hypothetical protein
MRASVAPEFTVTAELAVEPFTNSVPALTLVAPEYVFVPVSVSIPAPILVRPPLPDSAPESVSALVCVSTVSVPLNTIALASESPLAAACSVVPLANVSAPVLSAVFEPTAPTTDGGTLATIGQGGRLHDRNGQAARGPPAPETGRQAHSLNIALLGCQVGRVEGAAEMRAEDYLLLKRAAVSRPSGEWNDDDSTCFRTANLSAASSRPMPRVHRIAVDVDIDLAAPCSWGSSTLRERSRTS